MLISDTLAMHNCSASADSMKCEVHVQRNEHKTNAYE